jgi:AAHS family 3-hydroxyphenylpropionic acid transporter
MPTAQGFTQADTTATGFRARVATLLLCLAITALEGYDIQAFGVAAPHMMKELGLGPAAQGWIASAAMLGLVAGAFFGSYLSERLGRRPVLMLSVVMFGVFSIVTAMVESAELLFLVRFLAGAGFGGALPITIAIASEIASERRRALTVTTVFCGLPTGAAIVALFARGMGDVVDWRMIFIAGGVPPIVLAPLVLWLISARQPPVPADHRGPVSDLLGEGRATSTLLIWCVFAMTLLLVYLMLNWLPTLVISKGLSAAEGASAAFVFNLASIAGAFALAAIVDKLGFRWPLCAAYLLLAAVIALMAASDQANIVLMLSALAGFLAVGPQCALYALIPSVYPSHARVLGAGAAVGIGRFGSIVGPMIAGQLRDAGYSANEVFLILAPLAFVACLAVFLLGARNLRTSAALAS